MSIEEILLVKELASDYFKGRGKGKAKDKVSAPHQNKSTKFEEIELYPFLISALCDAVQ
jgi:hypothetical protein